MGMRLPSGITDEELAFLQQSVTGQPMPGEAYAQVPPRPVLEQPPKTALAPVSMTVKTKGPAVGAKGLSMAKALAPQTQTPNTLQVGDADYQALVERLNNRGVESLALQQKGIDDLAARAAEMRGRESQVDLSPVLAQYDAWFGKNLSKGYKAPTTPEEREAQALQLEQAVQKARGSLSATDIELLKGQIASSERHQDTAARLRAEAENRKQHEETIRLGYANVNASKEAARALAEDKNAQATAFKLDEKLDPDRNRSGNFGKYAYNAARADSLLTMTKQYEDHNLPPDKMAELAIGLAAQLGGGAPGHAEIERLIPPGVGPLEARVQQWFTSTPYGTGQPEFVKSMLQTVNNERKLWRGKVREEQKSVLPAFAEFKKNHPEIYQAIVEERAKTWAEEAPSAEEAAAELARRSQSASAGAPGGGG